MSYALSAPLRIDFETSASKEDPFAFFAHMREQGPVIPLKLPFVGKGWVTTTYEATSAMVKDNARFVQEARHAGKSGVAGMRWWMPRSLKLLTNNMLLKDEGEMQDRVLEAGDWVLLPAHCRHRVTWTQESPPTVWLAIHYEGAEGGGERQP